MTAITEKVEELENSLGIPRAIFLEDVEKFMKEDNKSAEDVIRKLEELFQKYRVMEVSLMQKKDKLKSQVPDIKMSLEMVKLIQKNYENKKTVETDFILAHNLYARAEIPPTDRVGLWLGANVMLEYSIEQADDLLTKNLNQANLTMEQTDKDLDFLKDQITTTEVNIARVYNWDVKRRQQLKQQVNAAAAANAGSTSAVATS